MKKVETYLAKVISHVATVRSHLPPFWDETTGLLFVDLVKPEMDGIETRHMPPRR
ncbi:MAG TPA: hypothetical protein VGJ81_11265 [Thermoanaerobaculia bacterium]